jgi:NADPH2:quinone reductase
MQAVQSFRVESYDPTYYFPLGEGPRSLQAKGVDHQKPRSYGANEVLVRVHAVAQAPPKPWSSSSTNASSSGLFISGTIEPMGSDFNNGSMGQQQSLKPGTEVYGMAISHDETMGAEFIITDPSGLAVKPKNLTRAESAAVAMNGLKAWQALFVKARVPEPNLEALAAAGISSIRPQQRRQQILVTDAAEETGIYLVQLAAMAGLHVVAVCRSRAQDESFLMSLGASEVIEHMDLGDEVRFFDYVINNTSDEEVLSQCWSLVANDGTFISLHPDPSGFEKSRPTSRRHVNAQFHIMEPSAENLTQLSRTLELGFIKPFVAETFPLEDGEPVYENTTRRSNRRGSVVLTN